MRMLPWSIVDPVGVLAFWKMKPYAQRVPASNVMFLNCRSENWYSP